METAVSRNVMAEFRRYPLRLEQSKLDGWWFIFVDALPGLLVFGPNYEDLPGGLKSRREICFATAEKLLPT